MSRRAGLRAHPVLLAAGLLLGLGVVVVLLGILFIGRDERRAGRIFSAILSERLGHPVRITRVATDGTSYLTLAGIRVPPSGPWTSELTIREIRVEGRLLRLLVSPGGQHLRVRVVSTSLTVEQAAAPAALPTGAALEQLRGFVTRLLHWPASGAFTLSGGELKVHGQLTRFDLAGEKSGDGRLALRLTAGSESGPALVIAGAGSVTGDVLELRLTANGDPRALGGLWPAALAVTRELSGEATLRLPGSGRLELAGQVTLTPTGAAPPLTVSASASYVPDDGRLDLPRLSVGWGASLALDGSGQLSGLMAAPRLALAVRGAVEGTEVRGSLELDAGERTARSVVHVGEARLQRWFARFAVADRLPRDLAGEVAGGRVAAEVAWAEGPALRSAHLAARFERAVVAWGQVQLGAPVLELVVTVSPAGDGKMLAESSIAARALDARLAGAVHRLAGQAQLRFQLPGSAPWRGLGAPDRVGLTLSGPGGPAIVEASASATGEGSFVERQYTLQISVPDLGRLPRFVPGLSYALSGSGRLDGRLAWSQAGAPRFRGEAQVRIPQASFPGLGAELTGLAGNIPVWHGVEGTVPPGTVTVESLTAYGLAFERFSSPARLQDGVVNLPETTYAHYGGTGAGWIQADLGDPSLPIRFRFEGSGVDVARFFAESGFQAARVTGRARYVVGLIHSRAFGVEVAGQFQVEPPGGVVSIDVLKNLLVGAPEDPLGVVRKTLEGLGEFRYKSLEGQLYMDQRETRLSLSLQGRERLGIFPPKIRAINIENLPLSRVMRILGAQTRRDR
ncbi:MAG: hypothetical protein HY726_15135 [Candidatus Rokubacteria bacterium]|nr:hypothetical protein [Candidatus Rokubacteria bacterium]